jgi:hypothetical protein
MGEQSQPRCTDRFVLGLVLSGIWIASCAPNGSGAGRQVASALCAKAAECCSEGEIRAILGPYVTTSDCTDRIVTAASTDLAGYQAVIPRIGAIDLPNLTYVDQAIGESRIRVDGEMLRICTEAITTAVCVEATTVSADQNCVPPDPTQVVCDYGKLFVGQVGEGGHCATGGTSIRECADGLFCLNRGIDGVCVQLGKQGDYCFDNGECLETLYCNQLTGTCQPRRKLGETCAFNDSAQTDSVVIPCEDPLQCDPFARVCVSQCEEGYSCSADRDCDKNKGLRCIVGFCDSVRQEDQPCVDDNDCDSALRCELNADPASSYSRVCVPKLDNNVAGCVAHADCSSNFCSAGTCRPQVTPPGACPSADDHQCAGGFCASSGYCVALLADGAPCQGDTECQSGACVSLSCARPPLANGQRCDSNSDCASEFCNYETESYCDTKPLDNGRRCPPAFTLTRLESECRSGVCLNDLCAEGLPEGADCTPAVDKPPCAPTLYCDTTLGPQACQPKHGPGEDCTSSVQCFGSCQDWVGSGRLICDATAPPGGLVCDNPPKK